MKLQQESRRRIIGNPAIRARKSKPLLNKLVPTAKGVYSEGFRLLKRNELVRAGDFVLDQYKEFEPWTGPGGFRAHAFIQPVYRQFEKRSSATKKRR